MKVCQNCGYKMDDHDQFCKSCGEYEQTNKTKNPPKARSAAVGIVLTIVFIIVGRIVGSFVGGSIADSMKKRAEQREIANDITEYMEKLDAYLPGVMTNDKYTSEHFGFQFEVDDDWEMYSKSDLNPISEEAKKSGIESTVKSMENAGASKDMIEAWKNSCYIELEMGASYYYDGNIVGEVFVQVQNAYGFSEVSSVEMSTGFENKFRSSSNDVTSGVDVIAGECYNSVTAKMQIDGQNIVNTVFIRKKGDAVCMIMCKAINGYEDEMLSSFKACTTEIAKN